jgi:hypothetical protein
MARAAATGALALTAAIVMTWPLASGFTYLGRTSNSGDGRFSVWNVAWVAHALLTDSRRLFDANIFHPHRGTLAYSEANLGAGLLAVPVWALTGNAQAAHNSVVLFAFAASLVTAWLLVRRVTRDGAAAATSAALFAFCPFVFAHTPHIQLLMTAGLPLSLLMFHKLVDDPSPRRGVTLGLALAAQALSCAYYGIFAGLIVAYGSCFYAWVRRRWRSSGYWIAIGSAAVVSMLAVLPFFLPYIQMQQETGFRRPLEESATYSAYLRSYLASSAHVHHWMLGIIRNWNAEVLFPGFLSIGLSVLGLAHAWREPDTATPPARVARDRETAIFYVSVGLLGFWTSLGPRAGLYTVLFHVVPVFSLLHAPGRTGIIVTLSLAVLAGFGVRALRRKSRVPRAVSVSLCAAALVELNDLPIDWRLPRPVAPTYAVLAHMPRGALIEFPFFERRIDFHIHTIYMLNSTLHWQPLVNGYSDHIPQDFRDDAPIFASFPSRESFAAMRKRRVRYIATHRDLYGRAVFPEIEARLDRFREYVRPVARDDNMQLYEIVAWPK